MKHFAFKLMLFIWLILFLNNSLTAQLYINEWMPDNDNYLTDQEGEYDDWFEIYNAGTVAVNLNGYFLSDDPAEPQLFQVVQNLLVPADGFLLLWADGDLDQGDNHVDFKLSANGESIVLSDPAGNLIHQVDFGPFPTDFSSGFFSDGSANQIIFEEPTPGTANNGQAVPEPLSPPLFTIDGGFYTQTQNLTLQLPPDATQVYYTLNSSAPHPDSSDTFLYNNPITISETTVVRAVSSATGFQNSPVASEIYYFNTPYNLPTLSIIADLDDLFGPDGIHTNPFEGGSDWERFCQLELFETGGGGFAIDAGIRIQGSSSVGAPKKSFRIFFEEEYGNKFLEYPLFAGNTVEAFRNIVLRSGYDDDLTTGSGTLLRDPLASDIYEKTGGLVADRRWAILTINGEYWGIYDIRESVNEHFIESHINDNDFDMIRMTKFADDLKEGSLEDWTLLRHFLNHNDCSNPEIYAEAIRDIDVENLINFLAFVQVTAYNSWTWGTSVYKADNGGKWRFTPWDMDRSLFSREWDGFAAIEDTSGILYNNYLPKSLVRNEGFRHQFLNRTADLLNSINETNNIIADLNLIKNEISSEVPDEINRWVPDESFSEWEEEVENIEELLEGRPDTVRSNAVNAYNLSGTERLTLNVNGPGTLEVNTLLPASFPWSGIYFRDVPVRIKAVPDPGYAFAGWSDPDLPISTEIVIDVADYSDLTANFVLGNSENVNIVINEINYHSPDDADGGDWIELYNDDTVPVDLSGWTFFDASGKGFTFMDNTILPDGEYLILAADKDAFLNIYPWINNVIGNFAGINDSGFSLSNGGELLRFTNADESFTDLVDYSDDAPWPVEADGQGPSLQLNQPGLDNAVPENWTASVPTPGRINFDLLESQNIIFPSIADQPTDAAPIEITAAATSGLEVSLEILNGPATLNDNILTLTGEVGTVTIRATQAGDNEYMPAPPVTRSFEVYEKENQTISFASIADQPTDASPIEIMATASSGLAVTLEILNGPATLNNNTLTLTGEVGTVTIRATQSGDNFYNAAAPVTRSFEVYEKENQTISFASIADQPTDASSIEIMATASSGLAVTLEILNGPATLNNNTLTLTGAPGTVTIRATQSGDNFYNAATPVIRSFEVYEKENQTISFASIADQPTDASPIEIMATASSGLAVSLEILNGPATLNNNTLTLTGEVGTVTIRATQSGDDFYNPAAPVTRSFEVYEKENQTISFASIVDQPTDASPIEIMATATSGLTVTLEILNGPATLNNNTLTLAGVSGTVTIRTRQSGNDFYNAAAPVTRSFGVYEKENQTISFASIADQPTDASPIEIMATASSGLAVSLEILNGPATLNNNTLTLTGEVGTVTIRATQSGDDFYNPAAPVTRSFEVYEKENQTISFASIADQPTDASPIEIMATASSGLVVSLEILNGPATLNNNILTLTGVPGTVTIRATQSGDNFYNAASPVTRSFEVYEKENQTISFPSIADQPTDASPIEIMATASSGLAVSLEIVDGPATLNNNTLTLTGVPGTVTIRATQSGDNFYNPASPVTRSFEVYEKENQTISFPSIADQPTDASPIEIMATASSGLAVSLEILDGPASLNNNTLTLTGVPGTVTIRATQSGDDFYNAAAPVTRSFEVYEKENQTISFPSIADQPTDASPIEIMATASSGLAVSLEILDGPASLNNNTLTLTGVPGTVTIRATQSGDDFYNAAAPVTRSFEVYEKENQTINFPFIADQPTDASPILLMATASSGLNVEYEILSGPAMLIGNTIELAGTVGVVRIRAFQNGNINYNAAAEVIVEFNVYEKESQTINFPEIPDQPVGTTEVTLGATASSGLSVSYELVGGPAIVSGNTLLLDNVTGIVSVRAVQNGDLQYQAAPPVIRSFTIIEQLTQVIELPAIPDQLTTAPPVVLPVVASSGLPIQYEVVSGPATIENGIEVVLDGIEGVIIIRATQPGNAEFSAAMPVEVGFAVILSDQDFPAETCMVDIDPAEYPYISEVIFGTISNTSENENYSGNLDQQTILNRAATVPLTLGIEKLEDTYISVWIDYNRNGSFADEGEIVFEAVVLGNNSFQLETEITVPTDARIGATRMRLIAHRNDFASPCPASYSGEVEDYGIYLDDVTNIPVPTEILPAIRPNPFTDYVEIDWPVSGYEMSVYNSIGQRVYYRVVNGSASNIATNHWENGIYFIKLRDQQGKIITQVLIK